MRKISNMIYVYRGYFIMKDEQGVTIDSEKTTSNSFSKLFATYEDARNFIDKMIDGICIKKSKIIGRWETETV